MRFPCESHPLSRPRRTAPGLTLAGAVMIVAAAVLGTPALADRAEVAVEVDGVGGDAWTFEKRVTGRAAPACDEVRVVSPRGEVVARREGPTFSAEVPLTEGANEVRALCVEDGERVASPAQTWTVRLADRPRARARVTVQEGRVVLDAGGSGRAEARDAPLVSFRWTARAGNPAPLPIVERFPAPGAAAETASEKATPATSDKEGAPATAGEEAAPAPSAEKAAPATDAPAALTADRPVEAERLVLEPPRRDGEYYVRLEVADADGRRDAAGAFFRVIDGRPQEVDLEREHAAWIDEAVVYGAVPFLFGERGLADVTARLDELAELGVSAIWLSPLHPSPEGDFGYAVTDHFGVRPAFGTSADLRRLVREAHARGLRVLLDFVPNHVSDAHPYWRSHQRDRDRSPYRGFFEDGVDGEAPYYFQWTNLRNLELDDPEVQRYVIEAFAHWVRTYDVDGFRVDVAWGPRRRAPELWPRLRRELKRLKPDLLLLAEASGRDGWYYENGFDAAYDWTDQLGVWAWQEAFESPGRTAAALREALTAADHPDALVMHFLENNDTGARFVTRHGPAAVRPAAALMLTVPGIPALYTGQEVGAEYEPYGPMEPISWEDRHGLRPLYRKLIELRRERPALRSRRMQLLEVEPADTVLAFLREPEAGAGGAPVVVLLNFADEAVETAVPAIAGTGPTLTAGAWTDLLSGERVAADARLSLPPYGVRILAPTGVRQG